MPYSQVHGYQWWGQPRTGSRALMSIQHQLGFSGINTHECIIHNPKWDTIISIRNPYSRAISFWILRHGLVSQNQERISFEEYVNTPNEYFNIKADDPWNPIPLLKKLQGDVYTIRNENVIEDLKRIPLIKDNMSRMSEVFYELENDRPLYRNDYIIDRSIPYHHFYTQEIADKVYKNKEEEFLTWGYDRESWKTLIL